MPDIPDTSVAKARNTATFNTVRKLCTAPPKAIPRTLMPVSTARAMMSTN